ncbi:MAG: DUF3084 domain-containing protein [Candidatus Margulisiibacteriota bacterium]
MFAFQVILIVVLVSGLIAFVGDRVGHVIGRKRLTLFNLRPRHTAIAITVITGATIAIFTGAILFAVSSDVRTAVFGLDQLKKNISASSKELEGIKKDKQRMLNDIDRLNKTLEESKKEIASLQKTKEKMSKEITTARSGQLLYSVGDIVTSTVIDVSRDKNEINEKLSVILLNTDSAIKKAIGGNKEHYLSIPTKELDEAVSFLSDKAGSAVIRLVAASNVILGEEIPVHFEIFENTQAFQKGEIILTDNINGSKTSAEIEEKIKELLSRVNEKAIAKGMLPGPDGSVGTIPYSRIFEVAKTIKSSGKTMKVNVLSLRDTFSTGPLEIELSIKN